jgi:zinc protease
VHDLQIAQSVEADLTSLTNGSTFTVTATAKPGHTPAELEAAIDAELHELARRGPTRAEVDAAKTAIIARSVRSLDNLGDFGGLADQLNYYNHYLGDPDRIRDDLRAVGAVTAERVRRFTADQLDPDRRVVIEVVPGPKMPVDDPPERTGPEEAPGGADAEPDGAGEPDPAPPRSAEPWRDAVPVPGPAPAPPALDVERFTLGNGLPVWMVRSDRLPVVSAALVSRLGSAADPPDRPGLTDLATGLLDKGTTSRDALGLARELESAGATLAHDTGKDGTWLSASSLTGHADETLAILADVARNPTFPADEVERVRDAAIVSLGQSRDSAGTIAETVAEREIYGAAHPYGHPSDGTEDGLRAATVEDLRRAHARAFTPATTALLLAGDLEAPEAKTLAEQAFGSWAGPAGQPPAPTATGPPTGDPDPVLVVDEPGASQTALLLAAPGLRRADPDFEPTLLVNRIFGGAFASRLNTNLRETRGYTYGAYSSVGASRGVGLLTISMDVQTDATADAVGETLRELDTLTTGGVTDDELTRARQWMTGSLATLFATRTETLDTLRTLYLDELPVDYFSARPARLARLTTADVGAVARHRFVSDAFTVVAVGDRAAIEQPLRALDVGPVSLRSP